MAKRAVASRKQNQRVERKPQSQCQRAEHEQKKTTLLPTQKKRQRTKHTLPLSCRNSGTQKPVWRAAESASALATVRQPLF